MDKFTSGRLCLCLNIFTTTTLYAILSHFSVATSEQGEVICNSDDMQCQLTGHLNPNPFVLIQKHHPYTGNINSETSRDSKNAIAHCGKV